MSSARAIPSLATLICTSLIWSCAMEDPMTAPAGIELEIEGTGVSWNALPDIQAELNQIGVGVWPLRLDDVPDDIRRLLGQANLTDAETARLRDFFLLSRARLLEIVVASGRRPNVEGGGALETSVLNQGDSYPWLLVVQGGVDYTRFDRFHVNISEDGIGVDQVLQMISGQGGVVRVRQTDGTIYNLRLDCPSDSACWMFSYDGGQSHIGSLSSASPGTKLVVQAFGPAQWAIQYTDSGE